MVYGLFAIWVCSLCFCITSEFIKILDVYGPNPAPTEEDPEYEIIKNFVTTYDEWYNLNKSTRAAENKTHTNFLGLAGIN